MRSDLASKTMRRPTCGLRRARRSKKGGKRDGTRRRPLARLERGKLRFDAERLPFGWIVLTGVDLFADMVLPYCLHCICSSCWSRCLWHRSHATVANSEMKKNRQSNTLPADRLAQLFHPKVKAALANQRRIGRSFPRGSGSNEKSNQIRRLDNDTREESVFARSLARVPILCCLPAFELRLEWAWDYKVEKDRGCKGSRNVFVASRVPLSESANPKKKGKKKVARVGRAEKEQRMPSRVYCYRRTRLGDVPRALWLSFSQSAPGWLQTSAARSVDHQLSAQVLVHAAGSRTEDVSP